MFHYYYQSYSAHTTCSNGTAIHSQGTKVYGVLKVQLQSFSTSTLDTGQRSASRSGYFTPGERAPR